MIFKELSLYFRDVNKCSNIRILFKYSSANSGFKYLQNYILTYIILKLYFSKRILSTCSKFINLYTNPTRWLSSVKLANVLTRLQMEMT